MAFASALAAYASIQNGNTKERVGVSWKKCVWMHVRAKVTIALEYGGVPEPQDLRHLVVPSLDE